MGVLNFEFFRFFPILQIVARTITLTKTTMKLRKLLLPALLFCCMAVQGKEYHVSMKGNDNNDGSEKAPFRTIQAAAQAAYAGDVITVQAGTYRERIDPPRGGSGEENRIVYRAAPGQKVEIKGSEIIKNWEKVGNGVWKVTIPNSFFGDYNPYEDPIYGDWFGDRGRIHHTGEVFLNGKSLYEKETLEKVENPEIHKPSKDPEGSLYTWYCETDKENTTIWANFHKYDPNKELIEISTRNTCFYPSNPGVNYLTISGFDISQAATQWGAPTAEQVGMVATHWNKGWIIENNVIHDSKCSGITLGKEHGTGHNSWLAEPDIDGAIAYIEVTFRTLKNGWNKENIGGHIVRNNEIFNCEQTGICGSMGCAFSLIENNHIHHIWTKRQFDGAEIGGIKFHAAVDVRIRNNRIHNALRGVWIDWMNQGGRISQNLFYDNDGEDVFIEISHGPFLVDNNIMGSRIFHVNDSHSSAFVHNTILGVSNCFPDPSRYTPYFPPHSTEIIGLSNVLGGDDTHMNNLFIPAYTHEKEYNPIRYSDKTQYKLVNEGNVYCGLAQPAKNEKGGTVLPDVDAKARIAEEKDGVYLEFNMKDIDRAKSTLVTTERLGKSKITKQHYENPDGTPITFDKDYFGQQRSTTNPTPGAIESLKDGQVRIKVW